MTLPVVHVEGEPYDQGRQHGVALRDQIGHNLDVYYDRFQRERCSWRLRKLAPAPPGTSRSWTGGPYFDALEGMAAGSGHSLLDLLVLNVRYELLYYQYGVCGIGGPDGCTSFAVLPPASANGHLLLGQNWDWIPQVQGAVLHTQEPDGLETLSFTEAGIVGGKIGLNSVGLGLAINGLLSTADDWSRLEMPFHVRCYEILRRRSLPEAVRAGRGGQTRVLGELPAGPDAGPGGGCGVGARTPCASSNRKPTRWSTRITFSIPRSWGSTEPISERRPHTYWRQTRMQTLLDAPRSPWATSKSRCVTTTTTRTASAATRTRQIPPKSGASP